MASGGRSWEDMFKLLPAGEDFSTDYADDYYLYRSDWRAMRSKFVSINDGMQGMGEAIVRTQNEMSMCFEEVAIYLFIQIN